MKKKIRKKNYDLLFLCNYGNYGQRKVLGEPVVQGEPALGVVGVAQGNGDAEADGVVQASLGL